MRQFIGGKKFMSDNESVKNARNSGQHMAVTGKSKVLKVRKIIESTDRYIISNTNAV